jgi:hypothetical protein
VRARVDPEQGVQRTTSEQAGDNKNNPHDQQHDSKRGLQHSRIVQGENKYGNKCPYDPVDISHVTFHDTSLVFNSALIWRFLKEIFSLCLAQKLTGNLTDKRGNECRRSP